MVVTPPSQKRASGWIQTRRKRRDRELALWYEASGHFRNGQQYVDGTVFFFPFVVSYLQ